MAKFVRVTEQNNNNARSKAAQLRLQAMQSQLAAASALCVTAENALVMGQVQLGREAIEKARQTVTWVRAHLEERNHVPADSVSGIRDQLAELERRISPIEVRSPS